MISWKRSFSKINEEYEMAKKKKQALDNLLGNGKISQSTYDVFSTEIGEAIAEVEKQQKALMEKMNSRMEDLKKQIKTLEILFANFEIQHVTGEVAEDVYQREIDVLSIGIETAKGELEAVREAVNQLSSGIQVTTGEVNVEPKIEPQLAENVEVVAEKLPEPPVEPVEVKEGESFQPQQETQTVEVKAEGEEKQEA